jgi:hypothetical protein
VMAAYLATSCGSAGAEHAQETPSSTAMSAGAKSPISETSQDSVMIGSGVTATNPYAAIDVANATPVSADLYDELFVYPPANNVGKVLSIILTPTEDGHFLGATARTPDGTKLFAQDLIVLDSEAGQQIQSRPDSSTAFQASEALAKGDIYVWRETSSTSLYFEDFRIFSAVAGKNSAVLVADSDSLTSAGQILPMLWDSGRSLATDGNVVYWTAATAVKEEGDSFKSVLYEHALDGSGDTVALAENVIYPAMLDGRLIALRDPRATNASTEPVIEVVEIDQTTGSLMPLYTLNIEPGSRLIDFCTAPGLMAFGISTGSSSQIHLWRDLPAGVITGDIQVKGSGTTIGCGGEGFLVWGNGSGNGDAGEYLLQLDDLTLYKLGELSGGSNITAAGRYVTWARGYFPNSPFIEHVVARWRN